MKQQPSKDAGVFRWFADMYLTMFFIFSRNGFSNFSQEANNAKGIGGVSLIEFIFLFSVVSWTDAIFGCDIIKILPTWLAAVGFLILCLINRYPLVVLGHGKKFEHDFCHLAKKKKCLLIICCITLMIIVVVTSFLAPVKK